MTPSLPWLSNHSSFRLKTIAIDADYDPQIATIRDERPPRPRRYKARSWVVERTLAWLSKCRAILIRWDKQAGNYLGLLKLACALLWYRRQHTLSART